MDVMQIRRSLLMQMIGGTDMGVWTQKQVTVQTAILLGDGFNNLITANLPSGTTFAIIVKDDLNPSTFINNQLVVGFYDSANIANNGWSRYQNGAYTQNSGNFALWSNTYAITASAGDKYTIFYQ